MSIEFNLENDEVADMLNSDNDDFIDNIDIAPRRKKLKKRSLAWEYFEEVREDGKVYAKCKLCTEKVTQYLMSGKSKSGTGNLTRHLGSDHADVVVLGEFDRGDNVFVFSQDNFRKALIKWIIVCDQPFTEPQQETFIELVHSLNPDAQLISDKTVRADIMETFETKLEEVKEVVAQIPGKMSVSLDGWTSRNVLPFMAIRGHWLDSAWKYHSTLLDFAYIPGKHTGWKHSSVFRECLSRLNIPITKVLGVTLDNASNNDTFFDWMEECGMSRLASQLRCICHILNLAVQDLLALLKVPVPEDDNLDVQDLEFENEVLDDIDLGEDIEVEEEMTVDHTSTIITLRTLIKKIRKSVQLRQKLKKCCGLFKIDYRVPILDVKNRWNSTYHMIIRAKELRTALHAICSHTASLASLQLTDEEWSYLSVVEKLLGKFDRATKLMSMERHATIHSYICVFNWLRDSVEEFKLKNSGTLRSAAEGALIKLDKYKLKVTECIIPFIATILHPALKLAYFKEHGYSAFDIREIKQAVSEYFISNYETTEDNDEDLSSSGDELHAHMFKRSRIERTSSELTKYLSLPLANRKVDPVEYWKAQTLQFPHLSLMARDILSAQPASTCVERDFSKGGKVITPTRCALLAPTIRASMCLKSWFSVES